MNARWRARLTLDRSLPRIARSFAILCLVLALLLGAAGGAGYWLWRDGVIQSWAQTTLVRIYFEKIRDQLPFEVEKAEITRDWSALAMGKVNEVSLTLKKGDWRVRLEGPLRFPPANLSTLRQLFRKIRGQPPLPGERQIRIDYFPKVRIEPPAHSAPTKQPSPLKIHLWAVAAPELNQVHELGLETEKESTASDWKWLEHGVELQKPLVKLRWNQDLFEAELGAASLALTRSQNGAERAVNLVSPHLALKIPLKLQPFSMGPDLHLQWSAASGEALIGERYFSASRELLTGTLDARTAAALTLTGTPTLASTRLEIGPPGKGLEILETRTPRGRGAHFQWKLASLPLRDALPAFLSSTASAGAPFNSLSWLKTIDLRQGELRLQGSADLPATPQGLPDPGQLKGVPEIRGELSLEDVALLWPARQLAVHGLNLRLPFSSRKGIEGEVAISRFGYRKLRGALKPTRLSAVPQEENYAIHIGEKGQPLALDVEGTVLRLEGITGRAQLPHSDAKGEHPLNYSLTTSLELESMPAENILGPLCVTQPGTRIPPATIHAQFPKITLSPGVVDITGSARAELFEGFIEADELGIYDFLSEVPEFDFNLNIDGVRLDRLGSWLNFGEMDGTLTGYAHEVVFQSWLPTQYDLKVQLKPLNHSDVVFSPEAMKNFARLFAEDGIDQIPGFAQWLAFGWPSRMLGGYDIDYAGIHISSEDGFIRLETLDPAQKTRRFTLSTLNGQKHFILYGKRFKIPLRSSRYPVILDAAAMGNFVRRKVKTLSDLAKKKAEQEVRSSLEPNLEVKENENEKLVDDDSLPAACIPSDLAHL